jgi:hypothetical protein
MATGVGGIMGCFLGGVMTQFFHPKYSYLLYSFMGLMVSINGLYLTKASEEDTVVVQDEGLLNGNQDAADMSTSSSPRGSQDNQESGG